jgi:hypothetical protein
MQSRTHTRLQRRLYSRVSTDAFKVPPMSSKVWDLEPLVLNGVEEKVVKGGRHLFPKLKEAFRA